MSIAPWPKTLSHAARQRLDFVERFCAAFAWLQTLVLCQPESQGTPLVCSSRRRRGSPLYLGRAVTPSPQTQGEVAVLGRLAMCRPTVEPRSCWAGASPSRGYRLSY